MPDIARSVPEIESCAEGCRIERFTIHSPAMDREIKAVVVLPPEYDDNPDKEYPVLYTLHGAGAPYDTFAAMSRLRSFIGEKPFIFTCFDADNRSLYIDAPHPLVASRKPEEHPEKVPSLFTTFFFKEFVPGIDSWYRIDGTRRAITGFSMGGFGSFHYMLSRPGFFTSVSGMSAAFFDTEDPDEKRKDLLESVLGPREGNEEQYNGMDHYLRVEGLLAVGGTLPPIYQTCGRGDFLIEHNRKMAEFAKKKRLNLTYVETEGEHDWKFWHPAVTGVAEFHWKYFNQ